MFAARQLGPLGSIILMLSLLTGPAWSQGTADTTADTAAGSAADSAARAAAIEAFKAGQRSYAQGDMTTALGHFNAAYELDPNPTLMFNLANVYAALDRPKESVRYFRLYLRDAPPEMRQEDEAAVTALMQRLKLRMEDLEPQVEDPPYDPRPTFRTSGWISLGLGAVALGMGTVYGFQLQGFEDDHRAATTAREKARTRDEGEFAESMASGMLVAGGILAGAGALFLWLGAEDDGGPSESGIIVGPGQVGWSMSW